jgi:hypothetical protein
MHVVLPKEPAPDGLPGSALEEDIVGDDDRRCATYLQQALDVLKEVELLVRGGGPEVVALVDLAFAYGPAVAPRTV